MGTCLFIYLLIQPYGNQYETVYFIQINLAKKSSPPSSSSSSAAAAAVELPRQKKKEHLDYIVHR